LHGESAIPGGATVFADTLSYTPQALAAGAPVVSAMLAGVALPLLFFLALHWTQRKRAVYVGTMAFAIVETLRLWLAYAPEAALVGQPAEPVGTSPVISIVLSYACIMWITPRLFDLRSRLKPLANFCNAHVYLFGGLVVLAACSVRFPLVEPLIVVWTGLLGPVLAGLGGWQALRGPAELRMPAFCFCLAYLLTSLVLALDVGSRLMGIASFEPLWLAAALARLLLVCGAVMLVRQVRQQTPRQDESLPQLSALSLLQTGSLSSQHLSSEQVERRLADTLTELASAVDMQRQINSMMSHELRVPVSTISAAAQSLEMILSGSGEIVDSRLARIRRSVSRITELLEQFLNQDRLNDQNFKVMREAVDLSQLARDVVASMQPDAGHSLMVDAPVAVTAWCDRPLSSVVLRNLIHNAIKYSPANQPVVIRTRRVNINGNMTPTLSVIDRGPGIDIDEQEHIFDAQYRRPSHRETSGMGIGLYLARRICQQQGGSLVVDSVPGRGARFDITLPAPDSGA
jgi:signal transduction histidine kinase